MPLVSKLYGYYPAKELKIGSDNETINSFLQTDEWVVNKSWQYFDRGLDIAAILQKMKLPPLLSLTGSDDDVLGHPIDTKKLLDETGSHQANQWMVVGRTSGFNKDYDHISLLTDPHARIEVFPKALDWIRHYENRL